MAGCAKADRHRKSAGNVRYKNENRLSINRKKAQARHAKRCATKPDVEHGKARRLLREKWVKAGGKAVMTFQQFKKGL